MLRIYSILLIAFPLAVAILSGVIAYLIPGCKIDEGAGAHGCAGLDSVLEAGVLGGFTIFMCGLLGLIFIVPLTIIANLWQKKDDA